MIAYVLSSLFESPAQTLVNPVNTVGVTRKGIAKMFRQMYPEIFAQDRQLCETKQLQAAGLRLYRTPDKWILNFPAKTDRRQPPRAEYIETGLNSFVACHEKLGITGVAFPKLGCGNGGLSWDTVLRPSHDTIPPIPCH